MSSNKEKITVHRSDGDVEKLSPDELERINYERKVRDQESAGQKITPKQINVVAVIICAIGIIYALPRILLLGDDSTSTYVPLDERTTEIVAEVLPPLPRDPNAFLQSTTAATTEQAITDPDETPRAVIAPKTEPQIIEPETIKITEPSEAELKTAVLDTVNRWLADWNLQNVTGYLSHYSTSFVSDKGQNLDQWKAYRHDRVTKPIWIDIQLENVEVDLLSTTQAQVQFMQNYSASNYADQSQKILILELSNDVWRIVKESSVN